MTRFPLSSSLLLSLFLFPAFSMAATAERPAVAASKTTVDATPTPAPQVTPPPSPTPSKPARSVNFAKALVVHKPMPSSSWGKVVQYRRDQILALSPENSETLHEFVFQDEDGVVRTAIFHENASGDGYWEVWAWDQQ